MCLIKVVYFQMYTTFHVEFMVNYKKEKRIVWNSVGGEWKCNIYIWEYNMRKYWILFKKERVMKYVRFV